MVIGRPFIRRLALPLAVLLLAVAEADAIVSWPALRRHLATLEPQQFALLFTILIMCWSVVAGRAFRIVWRQPVIAFLVRQPIGRGQWVRYLVPSLLVAFLPIAGIWWLAPHFANSIAHYAGFVGLAWPVVLGASYRGRSAAVWIVVGTSVLEALIFAYSWQPAVAYFALITTIVLIPLSVTPIPAQVARRRQISSGHLASLRPVFAIVRRDLCYLRRMESNSLFGLVWAGAVAVLMMFALRVNGHVVGREAFVHACGLFSLAVFPTYDILERVKKGIGPEFMRRRWPVSHRDRGFALICVMFVLMGPGMIAVAAFASTMGAGYLILFVMYATTTLVCFAALFSLLLAEPGASAGWGMLVLLAHTALAIALPPWIYGTLAVIGTPLCFMLIIRGLRNFTDRMASGILEQFA